MDSIQTTIELGHTNLEKARSLRDQGNQAMNDENYREALRFFHRCILLARAVEQTSSVSIHQNSIFHTETTNVFNPLSDISKKQPTTQTQQNAEERARQTTLSEDARHEAHKMMAECYLNLANCVLNGGQRAANDYLRAIQYCTNVMSYKPTSEQAADSILFKAIAYMKAEYYTEAIETFQELPDNSRAQQLVEECLRLKAMQRRKRDEMIQANFAKQQRNNERNGFPPDRPGMNGNALNGSVNQ